MEIDQIHQNCLLFSKRTVTHKAHPSTSAIKVECPYKYDDLRHKGSKKGVCVAISPGGQNLYYDNISKELILENLEKHVRRKLDKLFKTFKLNKVQNAFSLWRNIPRKAITKRKVIPAGEIVVKTTVANTLWSSHLIKLKRIACGILRKMLLEFYQKSLLKRFRFWKKYTQKRRYTLIHFFDKWNVRTSRIVLSKMNMTKFLRMLEEALNSSNKKKVRVGWQQFKTKCHQKGTMMKVKLLFTCWKTTTQAMREGRKRQRILFFMLWKEEMITQRSAYQALDTNVALIQKKKSFENWAKKYENRKMLEFFFTVYLNPLKAAWRTLKENVKNPEILLTETPKTSPRSMDFGPDLKSEDRSVILSPSNKVKFESDLIEKEKNENETLHTPSRCKIRKCLICSRKYIPLSSPDGFLLQSSLDGSFLKSSIDGSFLKSTPQSVKINKNENPFIRFTPEFTARKKSIRDPFSLIGTYSAVDIVPVLTDGSLFRRSSEINFDNSDRSIGGRNICGDLNTSIANNKTTHDSYEVNYDEDISKSDSKYANKKKSSNISFNFSPKVKNKNKITNHKQLNVIDKSKNKTKVLRDEAKDKNKNRIIRNLDTFGESVDSINIGIPHLVFSPKSVKIDTEMSQISEKDISVTEMIRPKKQISRMEQNFIKRLGIVQKLDNDFVVRKYSLNLNSVDV